MGDGYVIYKEDVKQGLREPAFVITHLISIDTAKLPNRYLRANSFNIYYFPKNTTNAKTEMYDVGEKLLAGMEYITVKDEENLDNLCRGTKMRYEIVDDVLHFFVNYDFFVKKEPIKQEDMGELAVKSNVEA